MYLPSINTPDGLRAPDDANKRSDHPPKSTWFEAQLRELDRHLERAQSLLESTDDDPPK